MTTSATNVHGVIDRTGKVVILLDLQLRAGVRHEEENGHRQQRPDASCLA
jgi:chemotaxis signal transduction protein